MHKFRATYLGAFIFGWLLAFGSHVAWGYYPPLQATGSYSTNKITYTVFNPQKQLWYTGSLTTTSTVVNMQQHNGVIAWVLLHNDSTYSVGYITFDPGLDTFKRDGWGPFTSVSQLQVMDGVVAYVAGMPPSLSDPAHLEFKYATYDPAKGAWQYGDYWPPPPISGLNLTTKDGVVLLRYVMASGMVNFNVISWDIYDPKLGIWADYDGSNYSTTNPITSVYIDNATIYYTETWSDWMGGTVTLPWWTGYNPNYDFPFMNPWNHSPTKPLAYFVAQPNYGKKPLGVWFTDMSIAGANWSYNFGDGSFLNMNRSPYYNFTSTGEFQVSQWISGPSTYSQTITVLNTFMLEGKSLPAILHLLLLAD